MLAIVGLVTILQLVLAATSPSRFVSISLLIQSIPLTWTWDVETMVDTPVGRLNVIAIQVFSLCLVSLIVLVQHSERSVAAFVRYKWHTIFIVLCLVSLVYAPSATYGLRMIAKLLGPLLFMIAVLVAVNNEQQLLSVRRAIIGSGLIIAGMAFVAKALGINSDPNLVTTGLSGLGPPGMGPPVFAAHMLPVAMLALSVFLPKRTVMSLLMTILFALCILGAMQRTSAGALFLGFSVIFFLGTRGASRLLLPFFGIVGVPLLLVFNTSFRQRMFYGAPDSQTVLSDPIAALQGVNSSGRFDLWGEMLDRFFAPHPLFGSGIGATQDYLYGHTEAGKGVVHSEYVRLLCELGIVGLLLFLTAIGFYISSLRRASKSKGSEDQHTYALAAAGAVVAYLVYMSTDNSFDYVNQFGVYVFALIALAERARLLAASRVDVIVSAPLLAPSNLMH